LLGDVHTAGKYFRRLQPDSLKKKNIMCNEAWFGSPTRSMAEDGTRGMHALLGKFTRPSLLMTFPTLLAKRAHPQNPGGAWTAQRERTGSGLRNGNQGARTRGSASSPLPARSPKSDKPATFRFFYTQQVQTYMRKSSEVVRL
jgi:hypothetical protein